GERLSQRKWMSFGDERPEPAGETRELVDLGLLMHLDVNRIKRPRHHEDREAARRTLRRVLSVSPSLRGYPRCTRPSALTESRSPVPNDAKSGDSSAITGKDLPYITSATIEASAKNGSTPVVRIAAGAVPARTASSSTAVVVDDPLLKGTTRTRPAA